MDGCQIVSVDLVRETEHIVVAVQKAECVNQLSIHIIIRQRSLDPELVLPPEPLYCGRQLFIEHLRGRRTERLREDGFKARIVPAHPVAAFRFVGKIGKDVLHGTETAEYVVSLAFALQRQGDADSLRL